MDSIRSNSSVEKSNWLSAPTFSSIWEGRLAPISAEVTLPLRKTHESENWAKL